MMREAHSSTFGDVHESFMVLWVVGWPHTHARYVDHRNEYEDLYNDIGLEDISDLPETWERCNGLSDSDPSDSSSDDDRRPHEL